MAVKFDSNNYTCYLIGKTSLLIQCCELLFARGWIVHGIISLDPEVLNYARKKHIPVKDETTSFLYFLKQTSFDYLFSIANEVILDKEVLNTPQKLTINYHDSLLPFGAGVFSTSWAILEEKKEHGVSWHIVEEGIDTGDILAQKKIVVDEKETTILLNAKCYLSAIESFDEMVGQIEEGILISIKQDLTKRTYHSLCKRPLHIGVLDFRNSKKKLDSSLRAFDFGDQYDNKFCTPKILVGGKFFIVKKYSWKKLPEKSNGSYISNADANSLDLMVDDHILSIKQLLDIDGEKVELSDVISEFELTNGSALSIPDELIFSDIHNCYEQLCRKENYWIKKLSDLNLVEFPFVYKKDELLKTDSYSLLKYDLNERIWNFSKNITNDNVDINLFSLLLIYISCLLDCTKFDIWYKTNSLYSLTPNLFSSFVPMACEFDKGGSIINNLNVCIEQVKETLIHETYTRDISTRIKTLQLQNLKSKVKNIPFFIGWGENLETFNSDRQVEWGILISSQSKTITLVFKEHDQNRQIAERFFHHFDTYMQSVISNNDRNYKDISLLTREELAKSTIERNSLKVDLPVDVCLNELIEQWALKTPNEIAIVLKDNQISYHELNEKANKIAAYLIANKTGLGDKVGILMDRSIDMVVSFLAIMQTGAAYVPLDKDLPESRLNYMIDDSGIKILIIGDQEINFTYPITIVSFEEILKKTISHENNFPKVSSKNLVYIKYTSGSSGKPKGVMISHKNVVDFLFSYQKVVNVEERRIGTCVAPLNFDTSIEEVYACLCFGGTVHIMMKDQTMDFEYFAKYLTAHRINVSYMIPEFIEGVGKFLKKEKDIYLKTLITGLHAKKNYIFNNFLELVPKVLVLNAYGPTEVTYGSNAYQVTGDEDPMENTPIGKPFPNYQTYVVDSSMQVVPDFIPGELLIGGMGLSQGYINKAEITKSKFVEFNTGIDKTRVYRSGDLVYSAPSGDIHFIGRNDDQVKISGYRIEIGEIIEAIGCHENVTSSVVIKRKVAGENNQLVAYITLNATIEDAGYKIRECLKDKLPAYMIPSLIVVIDDIPHFPNGKVNYSLLPEPNQIKRLNNQGIKLPENHTEEKIKQIFEEQLKINDFGIEDSFFDIGGDSLAAIHIMQRIEEIFNRKISISMLYQFPTIRKLSDEILTQSIDGERNPVIAIREGGNKEPIFFIHGMTGEVLQYRHIIKNLDKDHSVYGIQSNYEEFDIANTVLEDVAESYIRGIQKVTDAKKVILIGFSFGGIMAFEMAIQLRTLDYEVNLIMLDTRMNLFYRKQYPIKYRFLYRLDYLKWFVSYSFNSFFNLIITGNYGKFRNCLYRIKFETPNVVKAIKRKLKLLTAKRNPELKSEVAKFNFNNISISYYLVSKYTPTIYNGNAILLKCIEEVEEQIINKTKTNYVRPYVNGKLKVRKIDMAHLTVLDSSKAFVISNLIFKSITSVR